MAGEPVVERLAGRPLRLANDAARLELCHGQGSGCRPRPRAGAGAGVRSGGEPVPQHLLLRCMVTMATAEPAHRTEPANARLCVPVCHRRAIYLCRFWAFQACLLFLMHSTVCFFVTSTRESNAAAETAATRAATAATRAASAAAGVSQTVFFFANFTYVIHAPPVCVVAA